MQLDLETHLQAIEIRAKEIARLHKFANMESSPFEFHNDCLALLRVVEKLKEQRNSLVTMQAASLTIEKDEAIKSYDASLAKEFE